MPESIRYRIRSGVERSNARLNDEFGARHVRVRGHAKVFSHLMFGVLALTVDQLMRLAAPRCPASPSFGTVPASTNFHDLPRKRPEKAGERSDPACAPAFSSVFPANRVGMPKIRGFRRSRSRASPRQELSPVHRLLNSTFLQEAQRHWISGAPTSMAHGTIPCFRTLTM